MHQLRAQLEREQAKYQALQERFSKDTGFDAIREWEERYMFCSANLWRVVRQERIAGQRVASNYLVRTLQRVQVRPPSVGSAIGGRPALLPRRRPAERLSESRPPPPCLTYPSSVRGACARRPPPNLRNPSICGPRGARNGPLGWRARRREGAARRAAI